MGGLRTRDDINSLCINIIPEGKKDKSIVRFALECAARFFFLFFFLFFSSFFFSYFQSF